MAHKYLSPQAEGYLLEAKACEKVEKDLQRLAEKLGRAVKRRKEAQAAELKTVMEYQREADIQDAYGWGFITEDQYDRYLELYRNGAAALENQPLTVDEIARRIICRMLSDIAAERHEWEFSALSPEEQAKERERAEESQRKWKRTIADIKKRRGLIDQAESPDA